MFVLRIFICFFTIFFLSKSQAQVTLTLSVGEYRMLPIKDQESVHLQNGKILSISDKSSKIYIRALQSGRTSLRVGEKNYLIYVYEQSLYKKFIKLQKLLKNYMGLSLNQSKNGIQILGRLYRLKDWLEISEIFHDCLQPEYFFKAKISSDLEKDILKYLKRKVLKDNSYFAQLKIKNGHLKIKSTKKLKKFLDSLTCKMGLFIQYKDNKNYTLRNIKIKFQFIESSFKEFEQLGFKWTNKISTQILPDFINQSQIQNLFIGSANRGKSKLLTSSEVITQSGSSAEFSIGGEFPVPIQKRRYRSVVWKPYGIKIRVKPLLVEGGKILLDLNTRISDLENSGSSSLVPKIKKIQINNSLSLKNKQILVMSRFLQNNNLQSQDHLPVLERIPVLGTFFKSKYSLKNKTNLYLVITPEVLPDASR